MPKDVKKHHQSARPTLRAQPQRSVARLQMALTVFCAFCILSRGLDDERAQLVAAPVAVDLGCRDGTPARCQQDRCSKSAASVSSNASGLEPFVSD
jgi:hypothetical protein